MEFNRRPPHSHCAVNFKESITFRANEIFAGDLSSSRLQVCACAHRACGSSVSSPACNRPKEACGVLRYLHHKNNLICMTVFFCRRSYFRWPSHYLLRSVFHLLLMVIAATQTAYIQMCAKMTPAPPPHIAPQFFRSDNFVPRQHGRTGFGGVKSDGISAFFLNFHLRGSLICHRVRWKKLATDVGRANDR